jgi:putative tricarboxylic transport membrane protein
MILAPTLAKAALAFGSPEYFSLMLMSIAMVAYLVRSSMVKALITVGVGLLLGTVGLDPISGRERFIYGLLVLRDGIGLIPIVVGLFGVAEILETIGSSIKAEVFEKKIKGYWPNRQDWKDSGGPIARGTFLGFLMGLFPGITPMVPTFLSYGIEKRLSKHPERFGTGVIEGVAGPEACNNAASVGGFVSLLSLGIPTNPYNAVLLGALMVYGVTPGPLLIKNNPNLFWGVIASMYLGNAMLVILNLPLIPIWVRVLRIPYTLLSVIILIFCFIGSYTINESIYPVIFTFVFGVFGYLIKKCGFEPAPLILALVLGPLIEVTFRQSMIVSDGNLMIFVNRPISAFFILVALGVILTALIKKKTFTTKIEVEK